MIVMNFPDIQPLEYSLNQNLFCLFWFILILIFSLNNNNNNKVSTITIFILILIFSVFSFSNGDYFHYYDIIDRTRLYVNHISEYEHLEIIYQYIIEYVDKNYVLFRIIVWGGALFFYCLISKEYKVPITQSLLVLAMLYLMIFSYARASLAMAIFFYGVSLLYKGVNKVVKCILGIGIILISINFHKSIVVLLPLVPFAIYDKMGRKYVWCLILLVPFIGVIMNSIYNGLVDYLGADSELANSMVSYSQLEHEKSNMFGLMSSLLKYMTFYIPCIILVQNCMKNNNVIPREVKRLVHLIFLIIILSTCMLSLDINNNVMFYRILYMSMIPISIMVVYFKKYHLISAAKYKFILYLGFVNTLYILLYEVYYVIKYT